MLRQRAAAGALETSAPSSPAAMAELGQNPWPIPIMAQSIIGIRMLFLCNKNSFGQYFLAEAVSPATCCRQPNTLGTQSAETAPFLPASISFNLSKVRSHKNMYTTAEAPFHPARAPQEEAYPPANSSRLHSPSSASSFVQKHAFIATQSPEPKLVLLPNSGAVTVILETSYQNLTVQPCFHAASFASGHSALVKAG